MSTCIIVFSSLTFDTRDEVDVFVQSRAIGHQGPTTERNALVSGEHLDPDKENGLKADVLSIPSCVRILPRYLILKG